MRNERRKDDLGDDFEQGEEVKGGEKMTLVEEEAMDDWNLDCLRFPVFLVRISV